jgi:hypothetical protein
MYIALPIVLSIAANAIWEFLKHNSSLAIGNYPDIRGLWRVSTTYLFPDGTKVEVEEHAVIRHQWWKWFSGTLTSPDVTKQNATTEMRVRGEFKDQYHAQFSATDATGKRADFTAGLLAILPSYEEGIGAAANFGNNSPDHPIPTAFTLKKVR